MTEADNSRVPALDRGLDLLEWMAARTDPVSLTQIAQGLGLAVSEVQRPVACLHRRGYLNRSSTGAYTISGKLGSLAQLFPPHWRLRKAAYSPMTHYAQNAGESVHLCVPDGNMALLLLDVPGSKLVRVSVREGALLEPGETVSGRILLAYNAMDQTGPADPSLQRQLQKIHADGYEISQSSVVEGVTDVGVPVFDSTGSVIAAITVSAFRVRGGRSKFEELVPGLKKCAEEIRSAL